jgi:hypothetical protein
MYKYSDYIDVIVAIENLITSYTMRGERKIVEGLQMALDRALNYGDAAEIMQERNSRYKKRGNSV